MLVLDPVTSEHFCPKNSNNVKQFPYYEYIKLIVYQGYVRSLNMIKCKKCRQSIFKLVVVICSANIGICK